MCLLDKIYVIKQIAETLDYLHSRGCGHFNLKLSNIIISEHDSRAVLIGYELPSNQKLKSIAKKISSSSANFMSPEQIQGKTLDIRSDLYSLGSIFYTLLVGTAPYHSSKPKKILDKHLNGAIPQLKKSLSMFQPLLDKAMAKSPEQRFQSGEELIAAIDKLDDEEIIKADMPSEAGSSENSGQDKVVTLPTALSLQARQAEQAAGKPSGVKCPKPKKKDSADEGPFQKLNEQHNVSEAKPQKAETKVDTIDKPVKRTVAEPVVHRRKFKLSWLGGLVLVTIFFGAVFFVVQQKGDQSPVISTPSAESTRGSQALPGLIASPIGMLQSQGDKVANPQKPETDSLPNKTNEPETSLAPSAEQVAMAKLEIAPKNSMIESVSTKGLSPQLGNMPVLQNAPVLNGPADRVLPAGADMDAGKSVVEQKESIDHGAAQEQATKQNESGIKTASAIQKSTLQVVINQADTDKITVPNVSKPNTLQIQAEIERLLHLAEVKRSAGNLLQPADNNALLLYRQVLVLDENNLAALVAMVEIRNVVIDQIIFKMDNGQLESADALLTRMSIFFKPSPPYGKLVERLNRLKAEKNTVQKEETNTDEYRN
jgi:serine/threonine protein kinase